MLTLYDVEVVWTRVDSSGLLQKPIPEYHEWKPHETKVTYDHTVLVKVSTTLYRQIEQTDDELPIEFIKYIEGKTYRNNRDVGAYVAVVSDGVSVLAVHTGAPYGAPVFKSRVTPRQESLILKVIGEIEPMDFEWGTPIDVEDDEINESTLGLTRREIDLKGIIYECLDSLQRTRKLDEIRYWYIDLFPQAYQTEEMQSYTKAELVDEMRAHIRVGWSEDHERFGKHISNHILKHSALWDTTAEKDYFREANSLEGSQ